MQKFYHDTHLHLDLYKNSESIAREIEALKSYTIAVTNLPALYDKAVTNFSNYKYIRIALGFHPELVSQFPHHIPQFYQRLEKSRYIGEIGLDFTKSNINSKDKQVEVFKETIKISNSLGGRILSIHSRGAAKEVIEIIGAGFNGKIIMHWFTGNKKELKLAVENGYFFSINSEMVKSIKGREAIKNIPLNKILLESDGPFTKSVAKNYKVNMLHEVVTLISQIHIISIEDMYNQMKLNFRDLLKG